MTDRDLNKLMEQVEVSSHNSTDDAILTFEPDEDLDILSSRPRKNTGKITSTNSSEGSVFEQSSEEFNLFPNLKDELICKPTSTNQRKYRLFFVENPDVICGTVMSQGAAFCSVKKCSTNHKNSVKVPLKKGQLYVQKCTEAARSLAFIKPNVSSDNLSPETLSEWLKKSETLQEWSNNFRAMEASLEESVVATEDSIKEEKLKLDASKAYKTPKDDQLDRLFTKTLPIKFEPIVKESGLPLDEFLDKYSSHLNNTFEKMQQEINNLQANQRALVQLFNDTSHHHESMLAELQDKVGSKPYQISSDFDSPDIWSSIGEIINQIMSIKEKQSLNRSLDKSQLNNILDSEREQMKRVIQASVDPVKVMSTNVKTSLISIASSLKKQIDSNENKMNRLIQHHLQTPQATGNYDAEIEEMNDKIKDLERDTAKLSLKGEGTVQFHSLGFHGKGDSDAWLELHSPGGGFGFVVDFHTLMEHIHHAITGVDALKQLQTVYKLKLTTISEALAVTSFEVPIPRFLSKSGAHNVIDNEASYFSLIPTFKHWNDPNSGYKYRLKKELEKFRRAHLSTIRERIPMKSPLYNLATSSLTESISWTTGLINYIDHTYEEYSAGKFGTTKAWHVTTKLAMALITEVGKPREGALNSFEAGDGVSMSKVIFLSVLKSLDVMSEIASLDYRDSPVVSTELVKFLSLNTAVEAVDKLESKTSDIVTNMKQVSKDIAGAQKSIMSVGNKNDELKKTVTALQKRIEKLEAKK